MKDAGEGPESILTRPCPVMEQGQEMTASKVFVVRRRAETMERIGLRLQQEVAAHRLRTRGYIVYIRPDTIACVCDPRAWQMRQVLGYPGLHGKILPQLNKQINN